MKSNLWNWFLLTSHPTTYAISALPKLERNYIRFLDVVIVPIIKFIFSPINLRITTKLNWLSLVLVQEKEIIMIHDYRFNLFNSIVYVFDMQSWYLIKFVRRFIASCKIKTNWNKNYQQILSVSSSILF